MLADSSIGRFTTPGAGGGRWPSCSRPKPTRDDRLQFDARLRPPSRLPWIRTKKPDHADREFPPRQKG